jgi:hypothetical protein
LYPTGLPVFTGKLSGRGENTYQFQKLWWISIRLPIILKEIRNMFRIIQGRKSGNVKKADTLLVKLQGGPHVSMLLDVVKNPELIISSGDSKFLQF